MADLEKLKTKLEAKTGNEIDFKPNLGGWIVVQKKKGRVVCMTRLNMSDIEKDVGELADFRVSKKRTPQSVPKPSDN